MVKRVLLSWLGQADLNAAAGKGSELGPLAAGIKEYDFDHVVILCNYKVKESKHYVPWLKKQTNATIQINNVPKSELASPTHYSGIYVTAIKAIDALIDQHTDVKLDLTFHLSPGTPAMQVMWIFVQKSRFQDAVLIESSTQLGVKKVEIPFDMSAEFTDLFFREQDDELERLSQGLSPEAPQFNKIIHRCQAMRRVIALARRVAARSIPILFEGETGTGKELFAKAVHASSTRRDKNIVSVNCGAISKNLVDTELFGYGKGTFTNQRKEGKAGLFEEADGSTIFLDEIGELPLDQQVKLLRVLQEGEVVRVGEHEPRRINVRVIAATNKSLVKEVVENRFRSDLFFRLAVFVIKLPPLRERKGDLPLLTRHLLEEINTTQELTNSEYVPKSLSVGAENLLKQQKWPGNVRELVNTLTRATVWANGDTITTQDIEDSLLDMPFGEANGDGILHRSIDDGIDLNEIQGEVARHYLKRALEAVDGNKSQAAKLLGFKNYQTFDNWAARYEVKK